MSFDAVAESSKLSDDAVAVQPAMPRATSRITTGSKALADVDGRTRAGRLYRDILDGLVIEFDVTGEADMRRARLAATYSVALEESAAKQARGEPVDLGAMTTTGNSLRRLLADLAKAKRDRDRRARA